MGGWVVVVSGGGGVGVGFQARTSDRLVVRESESVSLGQRQ